MKEWMIKTATILFDDSKNDLRALQKTVRLQLLTTLSFVWSTAFTLYVWSSIAHIWTSLVIGHIAIIMTLITHLNNFIILKKTNIDLVNIIVMVEVVIMYFIETNMAICIK